MTQLSVLRFRSRSFPKEAFDKLASEMTARNRCHEQIAASREDLKTQLAEAA
jgi:hypothetical protein